MLDFGKVMILRKKYENSSDTIVLATDAAIQRLQIWLSREACEWAFGC
jgi:hypothetical protein